MKTIVSSLITFSLFTFTSSLSASAEVQIPSDPSKFKIIVLIGQSNMAGRGYLDDDSTNAHPRVVKMCEDFSWAPGTEPIHFDKSEAGACLAKTFAEDMANADPDIVVGLVPCAVGGTAMATWLPGTANYANFTNRAFLAMQQGTLTAFLWHQGESDCSGTGYAYQARFPAMMKGIRRDFGEAGANVPFIAGSLHMENADSFFGWIQNNTQSNWLESVVGPGRFVFAGDDYTRNPDNIHFTTASLRDFGHRYYNAYVSVTNDMAVWPEFWKTNDLSHSQRTVSDYRLLTFPWELLEDDIAGYVFPEGVPLMYSEEAVGSFAYDSADKTLTFYGTLTYPTGDTITLATNITSLTDTTTASNVPWNDVKTQVERVVFDSTFSRIRPRYLANWFNGFTSLTNVEGIANLNTSETIKFSSMFSGCSNLESLDVSKFDVSAAQSLDRVFYGCSKLQTLDVSGWRAIRANTLKEICSGCTALTSLDFGNLQPARNPTMTDITKNCGSLTYIAPTNLPAKSGRRVIVR